MGSKRLKALAVRGSQRAPLHDRAELVRLARQYGRVLRPSKSRLPGLLFGMSRMVLPLLRALRFKPSGGPTAAIVQVYRDYGTCSGVALATEIGDIPVRNWSGVGTDDLPLQRSSLISDDAVIQHQVRRYYCRHCAVGCGGFVRLESERFGLQEGRKPEFETLGAFGPLLLNDDLESIITAGNICDRQGMDTISTGAVVAFAIECAEKGLISREDAGGLDLSWGNGEAIVELVEMIARREGIGDLLAEGVRRASARIGGGADAFAMHAGGQELPMHDTRYEPLVAVGYQVDATPGRHTASMSGLIDNAILREAIAAAGIRPPGRYEVEGKGRVLAAVNQLLHVLNCSGLCIYAVLMGRPPLREWINAATGWELDVAEMLELGRRVQLTRHAFNAREGLELGDSDLPDRAIGRPPLQRGPLRGVTLDMEAMTQEYYQAVGLDPKTGMPTEDARQALGLDRLLDGSTGTH